MVVIVGESASEQLSLTEYLQENRPQSLGESWRSEKTLPRKKVDATIFSLDPVETFTMKFKFKPEMTSFFREGWEN